MLIRDSQARDCQSAGEAWMVPDSRTVSWGRRRHQAMRDRSYGKALPHNGSAHGTAAPAVAELAAVPAAAAAGHGRQFHDSWRHWLPLPGADRSVSSSACPSASSRSAATAAQIQKGRGMMPAGTHGSPVGTGQAAASSHVAAADGQQRSQQVGAAPGAQLRNLRAALAALAQRVQQGPAAAAAPNPDSLHPAAGGTPLHHPTLQLLRQRVLEGSRPGARRDAFKLGLAVEGGGMRGAVNSGALQIINLLGVRSAFDAVYGASAGALNATYFLSGQVDGANIYPDFLCTKQFINLNRLWRHRPGSMPALDLGFLVDEIMGTVRPLDWRAVIASPIPLKVVATSLDALAPVLLQDFQSQHDLSMCLKASANVPEVAGSPVVHRGQRLVDASVFEVAPFRSAIADGCTHVLVLSNRPKKGRMAGALDDMLESTIQRLVMSPDYMKPAWRAKLVCLAQNGASENAMLLRGLEPGSERLPCFRGAHVLPLYPGDVADYSPICIDVAKIRAGTAEGRRMMLAVAHPLLHDAVDFGGLPLPQGSSGSSGSSGKVAGEKQGNAPNKLAVFCQAWHRRA